VHGHNILANHHFMITFENIAVQEDLR